MRKFTSLFLVLTLLLCLSLSAGASEYRASIADQAYLLSSQEEAQLEQKAQSLGGAYSLDIVILTVDSMNGSNAQDFAEHFYESENYGEDGVLFLLAMAEREWYIATCGTAIYTLTDYGIDQLGDEVVPYLSAGDYGRGFDVYLDALPFYLGAYEDGTPVDGYADYSDGSYHGSREDVVYYDGDSAPNYLLSALIGLVVAGITVLSMRSAMNTKRPQRSAASYLKTGSYRLHTHQDVFLYSNVSKVRRQENNTGTRSGGGGSSVHRSSGGRHFGGGGGKF